MSSLDLCQSSCGFGEGKVWVQNLRVVDVERHTIQTPYFFY